MGFSGIGIWEILLILVVAVIVLGPSRLPEIARTLGKTIRAIRKASADLTTTVSRELEATENQSPSRTKEEVNAGTAQTPPVTATTEPGQDNRPTEPQGPSAAK